MTRSALQVGSQLVELRAAPNGVNLDAAVQKMKTPGELSDVVETQYGFHIIKFTGRRPAGIRPFENVKEALMREAEAKIVNDKRLEYIQKIQNDVKFDKVAIDKFAESNN